MESLKSFEEFITESQNTESIEAKIKALAFNCVYEAETGEVTVTLNEGFVQNLQKHIDQTIKILGKSGLKGKKLDDVLDAKLDDITKSFQDGDTPEESAALIS